MSHLRMEVRCQLAWRVQGEEERSSASMKASPNPSVDLLKQQGLRAPHSSLLPPGSAAIPQKYSAEDHLQAARDKLTASVANMSADANGGPPSPVPSPLAFVFDGAVVAADKHQ